MKKQEKNKKASTRRIFLFVILGILLVMIIIMGIRYFMNNNSTIEVTNNNNTNTTKEGYVEEIEDGIKINKSTKMNEAKQVDGLTISNIQLTTESGITTLLADVTNNSGTKTDVKTVEIKLLNKDGSELATVTGIVNQLEIGESTQLNISMTSDYINAYDFKVVGQKT